MPPEWRAARSWSGSGDSGRPSKPSWPLVMVAVATTPANTFAAPFEITGELPVLEAARTSQGIHRVPPKRPGAALPQGARGVRLEQVRPALGTRPSRPPQRESV